MRWDELTVLCLGGAGQVGKEVCRQLAAKGTAAVVVHDLDRARAEAAVRELRAADDAGATDFVASGGNLFHPASLGTWRFEAATGRFPRVCRETDVVDAERRTDLVETLLAQRLGAFGPAVVRESLLWQLADAYRPQVIVDAVNTATVLGYRGDTIQSCRDIAATSHRILEKLREGRAGGPPGLDELAGLAAQAPDLLPDLTQAWLTGLHMTVFLDTAGMIRFVQCLHALFRGGEGLAIPSLQRYVKVHTSGLGGMGFNIQYTHGDTGEPGLSTKLLGKVCATGSLTQLLMTLAHTPGCDVRVVVPATLIGWGEPDTATIRGVRQRWDVTPPAFEPGVLPLVDTGELVPCDGSLTLRDALATSSRRVAQTGQELEVPYLSSGENNPYAAEDITAITALGQMGCVTKEEVSRATLECVAGDSRYDLLTAMDAALLLPSHAAAVERDRLLQGIRAQKRAGSPHGLPSVSLGNLGPMTAKLLYEIEIIRACFETVTRVVNEATEMDLTLRACSYILEDGEGALLRRQILSLGIPVFLRKGPGHAALLLGERLAFPDPRNADALGRRLDPDDPEVASWLARGWIDLTGPRMAWWKERFREVHAALTGRPSVTFDWFSPDEPFTAGQLLGYLHSISGGQRKPYM